MDMPYQGAKDFGELKQFYEEFCNSRFKLLKKLFCVSMGIDYEAMNMIPEETDHSVLEISEGNTGRVAKDITTFCMEKVEEHIGERLYKSGRSVYRSADGNKGFIVCVSKSYRQGDREKYWYAYRRPAVENIKDCAEKNIVYICKDAGDVVIYPAEAMEKLTDAMNYSSDDDGKVTHWHVVFFRDSSGHMTQMLSKPEIREIDCWSRAKTTTWSRIKITNFGQSKKANASALASFLIV
ncbi:MAG: hypothetical protein LUC95_02810 [Lachnospiraceae bacterium]|nr:hypothetical protein [Lachnospiraceae bacterium]